MRATVKKGVITVTNALTELGLDFDTVRDAILIGELARDGCTANDPPSTPGYYAWSNTVRALRERLIPKGWERNDEFQLSTVVSPDGLTAIAVVTGDDGTGKADADPKTKYPKGPATGAAVNRNRFLPLFEERKPQAEEVSAKKRATWMLLRKRVRDAVLVELSLPASMTDEGQVEGWLTRIILDPITIEPVIEVEEDTSEQSIDVPVRRRS
ncbi:MAG: hypothetical protein M3362_14000 [Acidobacteriota bacterium]|nr:hypothetical protein [Acidobacteriota bacterium]